MAPKNLVKQALSVKKKGTVQKQKSASAKALKKVPPTIKPKAKAKPKAISKRPAKPVQRTTLQRVKLPKDNPALETVPQGLPEPTSVKGVAEKPSSMNEAKKHP